MSVIHIINTCVYKIVSVIIYFLFTLNNISTSYDTFKESSSTMQLKFNSSSSKAFLCQMGSPFLTSLFHFTLFWAASTDFSLKSSFISSFHLFVANLLLSTSVCITFLPMYSSSPLSTCLNHLLKSCILYLHSKLLTFNISYISFQRQSFLSDTTHPHNCNF